jgi:hypothetical protein
VIGPENPKSTVLYSAMYQTEGTHPQDAMKAKLDLLTKNLHVDEH